MTSHEPNGTYKDVANEVHRILLLMPGSCPSSAHTIRHYPETGAA